MISIYAIVVSVAISLAELANRSTLIPMLGLSPYVVGGADILNAITMVKYRDGVQRLQSLYDNPVIFPQIVCSLAAIAVSYLLPRSRRIGIPTKLSSLIALACFFILFSTTTTRSPIIVLSVCLAVYLCLRYIDFRNNRGYLMVLFAALFSIAGILAFSSDFLQIVEGRSTQEISSTMSRDVQKQRGMEALEKSPISGYGTGASLQIAGLQVRKNVYTVDNFYLSALVDNGYIGLISFWIMAIAFITAGVKTTFSFSTDPESKAEVAAMTAVIPPILVSLTVVSSMTLVSYMFLFAGGIVGLRGELMRSRSGARHNQQLSISI